MAVLDAARSRKHLLAMKAETVYGEDVFGGVYSAADVLPALDVLPELGLDEIEVLPTSGDLGRVPSMIGIETGALTFAICPRGAGAPYSASVKPELDRPFRGCSLAGTGSFGAGAESWTYQPGPDESFTLYAVQQNGRTARLVGCHGTGELDLRVDGAVRWRFAFQGRVLPSIDVAFVEGSTPTLPMHPPAKGAALQIGIGDYAPSVAALLLDLGNTLERAIDVNGADPVAGYFLAGRNPRLTIDPEAEGVADFDWHAALRNGTLQDVTWQNGTAQYNRMKVRVNAAGGAGAQIVRSSYQTRENTTAYATQILATLAVGNDDLAVVFD